MSARDRLKETQGQGSNIPKLSIHSRVDVSKAQGGAGSFKIYNVTKKESVDFNHPITGILIGKACVLTAFDMNLRKYYKSGYWISKNNIRMFSPIDNDPGKRGTKEEVTEYLRSKGLTNPPSTKQVLFILGKGGLMALTTNISIAIDQFQELGNVFTDFMITITPKTFSPMIQDYRFSKSTYDMLAGPFNPEKPPTYAEMSVGPEITDQIEREYNLEPYIDEFIAWREYQANAAGLSNLPDETPGSGDPTYAEQVQATNQVYQDSFAPQPPAPAPQPAPHQVTHPPVPQPAPMHQAPAQPPVPAPAPQHQPAMDPTEFPGQPEGLAMDENDDLPF